MNKDITYCVTGDCKLQDSCQRNCIGKSITKGFFSMAELTPNNDDTCDYYLPETSNEKSKNR